MPTAAGEELSRVVRYEAESQIPFPIDSAELGHRSMGAVNGHARVLLTACPRTSIIQRRDVLSSAGLAPTEVAVSTLATLAGLRAVDAQIARETCLIVDIGAEVTEVAIASQGEPASSFTLALGGRSLTLALANDLGLDIAAAERRKLDQGVAVDPQTGLPSDAAMEHLTAWLLRLYTGLRRALEAHAQASPQQPVEALVLLGAGGLTQGLAAGIAGALRLPIRYADPASALGFAVPEGRSGASFVTALGLAIQGLGLTDLAIDLTPREVLASKRARTERTAWAAAAAVLGVLLLAATAWQGVRVLGAGREWRETYKDYQAKQQAASDLDLSDVEVQALEGILARSRDGDSDPLELLAFLSESLPVETRLKDLSFARGDSISMKGEAVSNAAISETQHILEGSGKFEDIRVNHSTATDVEGRTLYTFDIQCKLKGGEAR